MTRRFVLFDLDGTLLDSAPDLTASANYLRQQAGLPAMPYEALREFSGKGARGLIRAGLNVEKEDPRYPALEKAFLDHYGQHMLEHLTLFDGVSDLLAQLKQIGCSCGIVTNKNYDLAKGVVEHAFGENNPFTVLIGGDAPGKKKPAPDHLISAIKQAGFTTDDTIYVGDDARDVLAAKNTNIPSVAVTWGYTGGKEAPYTWEADYVITQPTDLIAVLKSL